MSPTRTILRAVAAATLTTLFIACNAILGNESEYRLAPADAGTVACTLNSDCATGNVCIFKTCSAPCHEDVDCPVGSRCLDTTTKAGTACVTPNQAKCTGDVCPEGTTCSSGTCRTSCSDGSGCRTDQTCSAASVCVGTNSSHDSPGANGDGGDTHGSGGSRGTGGSGGVGGATNHTGLDGSTDAGAGGTGAGGSPDGGDAGADLCIGKTCEVQPAAECSGTTLKTYATVGSCTAGACTYAHTDTTCQFGCTAGKCDPDPCATEPCASPPAAACQDGTHLTTHDTTGSCSTVSGKAQCTYTSHSIACTCSNDACATDPCAAIACNVQSPPTCHDPNTRRSFAATGTCSLGSCTYPFTDTNCPFGCASGACNADPCAGKSCATLQTPTCSDPLTLRTYSVPGTCGGLGICSYAPVDTACTVQCTTNGGAACTCPAYYAGTGVGPSGCLDINECATNNGGCGNATYTKCTNVVGGPPTCADIDECATNNGGCGNAAFYKCTNLVGGPPTCADINECATNNGGCGSPTYWTCTNNSGAAPTCTDIDECATNNGGCGAVTAWACVNVAGGVPTCLNKNECTLGTNDCDTSPVATCTDTSGSFTCMCPGNYVGTGHGVNGCTCTAEPLCDAANEQNGSYCSSATTQVSCAAPGGCQVANSTTCKNVANEGCVGTHPSAKCEKAFGYPTDGGGSGSLGGAFLFGVPFTLAQPLTLTRIGLIARANGAGVRMAVYADSGGPAVWEASALGGTVVAGRNEYPVNDPPPTSPVTLPAGSYWIVAVTQQTTSLAQGAVGSVRYKGFSPWNTPFPTGSLAPVSADTLAQPNFYVVGIP